jgi:hypothetical protein
MAELERDITRSQKALGNENLLSQSRRFYSRRQEVEAEMSRRAAVRRS